MRALDLGDKVCGYCAQIRSTVYLADQELAKDPKGMELWKLGYRSIIATPLMYGSRMVGTLSFASKSRNSFALEELNFVTLIAQSIASVRGKASAEAQKHSSETQFRALVDCAADDFFLLDGELRIIDVNRASLPIAGV